MSEEEMKALVEMNNMLKYENDKLKQDKQELIEWLKNRKNYCIQEKDKRYREQLLGSYITCEMILEIIGE